jgi:hypothetical protein
MPWLTCWSTASCLRTRLKHLRMPPVCTPEPASRGPPGTSRAPRMVSRRSRTARIYWMVSQIPTPPTVASSESLPLRGALVYDECLGEPHELRGRCGPRGAISSIEHDARAARLQHGAACFSGEHVRLSAGVLRSKCCYGGG